MQKSEMKIIRTAGELSQQVRAWKADGHRVGLVPTMGALHHGHLSLVEAIAAKADKIIVSIYVNPTQFGEGEDLSAYPRDEAADCKALMTTPCDLIYAPSSDEMYPDGYATTPLVPELTHILEGLARPGHFDGVATVVTKLFAQSDADIAIFGEKDYQQLALIRRFVRDLNLPVEIMGGKLIRESDGLAASSRNRYLNVAERQLAGKLNGILLQAIDSLHAGLCIKDAESEAENKLLAAGFAAVDYVSVCDCESLQALTQLDRPARLLAVARIGKVRLLDNMPVPAFK